MASEEELDLLFSALSHAARRAVIRALGEEGEMTFTDMMRAAGIGETGTFGFHLKRLQPLLERTEAGKYRLSPLGRLAYTVLKCAEEGEVPRKKGYEVLSDISELMLDRKRLEELELVEIVDCEKLVIASDVSPELFDRKVLAIRDVEEIIVPRHLYRNVLRKVEGGVERIEVYEGETPEFQGVVENFDRLTLDCSQLTGSIGIENFGVLTLKGLTKETALRIRYIENFGVLRVSKGKVGLIIGKLRENYGAIEEYEEGGEGAGSGSGGAGEEVRG